MFGSWERPQYVHCNRLQGPLRGKQLQRVSFPLLRNAVPRADVAISYGFVYIFGDPRPKEGTTDGLEHAMCSRMAR